MKINPHFAACGEKMKRSKFLIRTLLLGAAMVAFGVLANDGKKTNEPTKATTANASSLIRFHSPATGPAGAKVTIVEFFDPSCEACRAFYPHVKAILAENPAQVRLVLRYAAFHKDSGLVVKMLEATKGQGLYWQALEATLKSQPVWADHGKPQVQALWNFLAPVGVDVEKAKRDMESTRIAEILKQDMADGVALEVERTPTFYVNGTLVSPVTPDGLRAKVREQINAAYP